MPPPTVSDRLAASRAAHEQYRWFSPRMATAAGASGPQLWVGDPVEARRCLTEARRLRREAHDLDPGHADPAWAADPPVHAVRLDADGHRQALSPHEALLAFDDEVLGPA